MCKQCDEIAAKIARYRRMANGIKNKSVLERLNSYILDLEAEATGLHIKPA